MKFSQVLGHVVDIHKQQVPVGKILNVYASVCGGVLTLKFLVIGVILPVHSRTLALLRCFALKVQHLPAYKLFNIVEVSQKLT